MLRTMAPIALSFALLSSAITVLNVSVPLSSSGAVKISPSLCSFSIEQDRWPEWAGEGTRNTFFYNALENLKKITGEAPWIRIGADSEDHTNFNAATEVCVCRPWKLICELNPIMLVRRRYLSQLHRHRALPRSEQYHGWKQLLSAGVQPAFRYVYHIGSISLRY